MLEKLELCVADTYYKTGPTFYGNKYRSNIDHIVVRNTFRKAERSLFIKVFEKEGSILQLPKTQKRLDHLRESLSSSFFNSGVAGKSDEHYDLLFARFLS